MTRLVPLFYCGGMNVHFLIPWYDMLRFINWLDTNDAEWSVIGWDQGQIRDHLEEMYNNHRQDSLTIANVPVMLSNKQVAMMGRLSWDTEHTGTGTGTGKCLLCRAAG